jgi:hypothetical protein
LGSARCLEKPKRTPSSSSRGAPICWPPPNFSAHGSSHGSQRRSSCDRLKLDGIDDRYETAITVAKAYEASKPEKWCRALLSLILAVEPASVVEMGTNLGISGLYIAAGLKVNGRGTLLTMEGAPSKAVVAASGFEQFAMPADVVVGDFATRSTRRCARGSGRPGIRRWLSQGAATVRYHEAFKRSASPDAVLVYDDINWSDGMKHAWKTISSDPDVAYVLDYAAIGVVGLR